MSFLYRHHTLLFALCAVLAHAGCSSEKATGPAAPVAVDSVPPVITHMLGPYEPVALGGEIELNFTVHDAVGVKQTVVSAAGAFTGADTIVWDERPKDLSVTYRIPVPDEANADVPVVITLIVSDEAGHTRQGETSVRLADLTPPLARLDFAGLVDDATIRTGETLDIRVAAGDNHRLKYVGYEGGGLRDSVLSSGQGDTRIFRVTVPQAWLAQRPVLRAWARDANDRMSPDVELSRKEVPVYNWSEHPIVNIPLQPDGYPLDVLWDAKRSAVYRLRLDSNGLTTRIDGAAVLSAGPLSRIALPEGSRTFALSASGDSLVVTLPYYQTLGIVDLLPADRLVTMMTPQYDDMNRRPFRVGHASGGRFFLAVGTYQIGSHLLDVDFATGAVVTRTDIDGGAEIATEPSMLRLPDGRLVIGPEGETPYPEPRVIYSPVSNSFTLTRRLRAVTSRRYSASPSGRFMMGSTVYGAALDSIANVSTQDWPSEYATAAALSSDGLSVFLSTRYGYQRVRLADGAILEQVKLAMAPLYLFAMADGSRLVALGESSVKVIDLR